MKYKVKIEYTLAALKKGAVDKYEIIYGNSISELRWVVYYSYFRNPKLRAIYYQVTVYRDSDLKNLGSLFVTRNGLGKLTYVWAEHPYNVGSPTYAVDKKTGILTGVIGHKRKDYTLAEASSYGWKPKYP